MKQFLDDRFLLTNSTAETLYQNYAKTMPIFDFHCHLNPAEIAGNKKYRNITEIWLGGDHYKWRAMRACGVEERYITGDAPDKEKFFKWAETIPQCIGNPLYHWAHQELKTFFGINLLLSPATAEQIWNTANDLLQKDEFTARSLIVRSNVTGLCTTDDPADSLEHHLQLAREGTFPVKVLPAFRPDKSFNIDKAGFVEYIGRLGKTSGMKIESLDQLLSALQQRLEFFHQVGCRVSDHALDPVVFANATPAEVDAILKKALGGQIPDEIETQKFKTFIMLFLGRHYARLGWVMQLHVGVIRNSRSRMMRELGPDTGFDAIADYTYGGALAKFLDVLDSTAELPKTVLYCLNPRDNEMLASIAGCFQEGGVVGKIQFGSGWWYNDQKDGMVRQMTALANIGLLSRFIGMLTDSRSFVSYTRHDYFRRILCDLVGSWVEKGEVPEDRAILDAMIRGICVDNARRYFRF